MMSLPIKKKSVIRWVYVVYMIIFLNILMLHASTNNYVSTGLYKILYIYFYCVACRVRVPTFCLEIHVYKSVLHRIGLIVPNFPWYCVFNAL